MLLKSQLRDYLRPVSGIRRDHSENLIEKELKMTTRGSAYALSETSTDDYEPYMVSEEAIGEVHRIRTEGPDGVTLAVGLSRSEPQSFPYPFDIASFTTATKSVWTVTQPFKKLFVISGRTVLAAIGVRISHRRGGTWRCTEWR